MSVDESYKDVMKIIVMIVAPIILSAFLYNVNGYINSMIYTSVSELKGLKGSIVEGFYAECGFFLTIINIPLTLSSTAPTSHDAGGFRGVCQRGLKNSEGKD